RDHRERDQHGGRAGGPSRQHEGKGDDRRRQKRGANDGAEGVQRSPPRPHARDHVSNVVVVLHSRYQSNTLVVSLSNHELILRQAQDERFVYAVLLATTPSTTSITTIARIRNC